jgi:small nuclear ribonucleoprotein (snRNP)-like protein
MWLDLYQKGPFQVLFECFKNNQSVTVMTRSVASIRGICTGTLIGYDKHMNLVR